MGAAALVALRDRADLVAAGFAPTEALHVYRAYFGFLYGHILNELQELVANPEETDDLLRLGLHRLSPREFPLLRSLASDFTQRLPFVDADERAAATRSAGVIAGC